MNANDAAKLTLGTLVTVHTEDKPTKTGEVVGLTTYPYSNDDDDDDDKITILVHLDGEDKPIQVNNKRVSRRTKPKHQPTNEPELTNRA